MEDRHSTKQTDEDYCLLPDDDRRREIIDGEYSTTPSLRTKHQLVSARLTAF